MFEGLGVSGRGAAAIALPVAGVLALVAATLPVLPDVRELAAASGGGAATSVRHRELADCLWPAARDHGFLEIQLAALDEPTSDDLAPWRGFLGSVGAERCGFRATDLEPLRRALAATRTDARRHFAAARDPTPARPGRIAPVAAREIAP